MRFNSHQRNRANVLASAALDADVRGVLLRAPHKRELLTRHILRAIELECDANGNIPPDPKAIKRRVMKSEECRFAIGLFILMAVLSWLIHRLLDAIFLGELDR